MVTTELKPLLLNLSDEDEDETASPASPLEEEEEVSKTSGTEEDGFDLDENLIETPGEEEF